MLDVALLRIGSEKYAERHGSVGLCTLRARHVTVDGETVRLRFRGKSRVAWETELEDPDLAACWSGSVSARPSADPAAGLAGRQPGIGCAPSTSTRTSARTGGDFTAKDFRTIHAIIAARSLARDRRRPDRARTPSSRADGRRGDGGAPRQHAVRGARELHRSPALRAL
jgi:DNA topoisomerase-1